MRVSTQDWFDIGFDIAKVSALSGLVDSAHTVAVIPRSDEAKMDAMMNHGFVLEHESNKNHYDMTMNTLGSINAKVLNQYCIGKGLLTISGTDFDKKLLKSFTKKYRRAKDKFSILAGEKNMPIRFITPCGDWWVLIAPRVTPDKCATGGTPIGLDPFPMEVLE
jgi:hypothetical protein